ncbi:hypothetical protein MRX96_019970 [Rhipicephalus microplus]
MQCITFPKIPVVGGYGSKPQDPVNATENWRSRLVCAQNTLHLNISIGRHRWLFAFTRMPSLPRARRIYQAVYGHLGTRVALVSVSSPVSCVIGGTCVDFLHGQPESIIGTAQLPGSFFLDK